MAEVFAMIFARERVLPAARYATWGPDGSQSRLRRAVGLAGSIFFHLLLLWRFVRTASEPIKVVHGTTRLITVGMFEGAQDQAASINQAADRSSPATSETVTPPEPTPTTTATDAKPAQNLASPSDPRPVDIGMAGGQSGLDPYAGAAPVGLRASFSAAPGLGAEPGLRASGSPGVDPASLNAALARFSHLHPSVHGEASFVIRAKMGDHIRVTYRSGSIGDADGRLLADVLESDLRLAGPPSTTELSLGPLII